jgi:hypothetical protein
MNAVTGFVAIVSLLLALAAGTSTAQRKAGGGQQNVSGSTNTPQSGGNCPPFACGTDTNHNETLVRDTRR